MFQKNKSCILKKDESFTKVPIEFNLAQNSPNPFSTQTSIYFSIPWLCIVKLVVYCRLEEPVSVLYEGELSPGRYEIIWNGTDLDGKRLKKGGYTYFLETDGFVASRRMTIKD